jgi:uncharacterized protein
VVAGAVAYVDSSALVKLVVEEPESDALRAWLDGRRVVTSRIAVVEVSRAVAGFGPAVEATRSALLETLDFVELDAELAAEAARIGPAGIRSLDAIHLSTALRVRADVASFVAYDQRLLAAARLHGLSPEHPGVGAADEPA